MNKYPNLVVRSSDINEHLPTLRKYAEQCSHITEFGVREVVSIWAYLDAGTKTIRGYDIKESPNYKDALLYAKANSIDLKFIKADTLKTTIEETEFLFIDTLHTYQQLLSELTKHHGYVSKYIGFHDVVTFGYLNEQPGKKIKDYCNLAGDPQQGLMPAILEFMYENPEWQLDFFSKENNGLLILKNHSA